MMKNKFKKLLKVLCAMTTQLLQFKEKCGTKITNGFGFNSNIVMRLKRIQAAPQLKRDIISGSMKRQSHNL